MIELLHMISMNLETKLWGGVTRHSTRASQWRHCLPPFSHLVLAKRTNIEDSTWPNDTRRPWVFPSNQGHVAQQRPWLDTLTPRDAVSRLMVRKSHRKSTCKAEAEELCGEQRCLQFSVPTVPQKLSYPCKMVPSKRMFQNLLRILSGWHQI